MAQDAAANATTEVALISFNIPAQSLASAVGAFGRQSGLQVTLSATEAGTVRTNAVTGRLTPSQALARMLAGTGVSGSVRGNAAIIAIEGSRATDLSVTDGATVLDTITVD